VTKFCQTDCIREGDGEHSSEEEEEDEEVSEVTGSQIVLYSTGLVRGPMFPLMLCRYTPAAPAIGFSAAICLMAGVVFS
jgi:hypothetical protein